MTNSFKDAALFFTGVHLKMEHGKSKALRKAGRLVRDEARRVLGTYDYGWPRLQAATIARKATGDSPLLETGAMRASIKYSVDADAGIVTIGSNDPKALWQELGTSRGIPPRSFLAGAATHKQAEVLHILGHGLFSSSFTSMSPDFEDEWSYDGED